MLKSKVYNGSKKLGQMKEEYFPPKMSQSGYKKKMKKYGDISL